MERRHPCRRVASILLAFLVNQRAGTMPAHRTQDACTPYAPVADAFIANSPFSFMISSVISAEAYISFTSSHSFTV